MIKILFVCHGNICRSPMAEFVMKDLVRKAGREVANLWYTGNFDETYEDVLMGYQGLLLQKGCWFLERQLR